MIHDVSFCIIATSAADKKILRELARHVTLRQAMSRNKTGLVRYGTARQVWEPSRVVFVRWQSRQTRTIDDNHVKSLFQKVPKSTFLANAPFAVDASPVPFKQ